LCRGGFYERRPHPGPLSATADLRPEGEGGEKFTAHENHADLGNVNRVSFSGCDVCFRTENLQAVGWTLSDISVYGFGGPELRPTVILDCRRAGGIVAQGVWVNTHQSTLLRIGGEYYNPFANRIVIRDVKWDLGASVPGGFIRAFQYDGPADPGFDLADLRYSVRIDGHLGFDANAEHPIDVSKFIDIPAGATRFPLDGILLDIERLAVIPGIRGKCEPVVGGPWVRPTKEWVKAK
jgi:hypothetical protein